jgi:hypothetical protein
MNDGPEASGGIQDINDANVQPYGLAAGCCAKHFEVVGWLAIVCLHLYSAAFAAEPVTCGVSAVNDAMARPSNNLIRGIPKDPLRCRVPEPNDTIQIDNIDAVAGIPEELIKVHRCLLQLAG